MYKNEHSGRVFDLRNVAKSFFEKSLACTKITDVKAFFDLAQQADAQADSIESDLKIESCWTYLHFVTYFGYPKDYASYCEFCVRNRFAPVSSLDFDSALLYEAPDEANAKPNALKFAG